MNFIDKCEIILREHGRIDKDNYIELVEYNDEAVALIKKDNGTWIVDRIDDTRSMVCIGRVRVDIEEVI